MKKIKYLLFIFPLLLIFNSQVKADTLENYGVMSVSSDIYIQQNQVNINNTLNGAIISVPSNTIPIIQFYPSLQGDPYTFSSSLKGTRLSLTATICTTGNIRLLRVNYSSGTFPYGDLKLVTSSSSKISTCTINGNSADLIQLKAILSIENYSTDEDRGIDLAEGYTKFEYNAATYSSLWRMDTFKIDLYNETNSQNDTIINQNEQMIQKQQETKEKLDDIKAKGEEIKDSIKDGFENCRDSYNLFNNTITSYNASGITTNFNNNTYTLNGTVTKTYAELTTSNTPLSLEIGTYTISIDNPKPFKVHLKGVYKDDTIFEYAIPLNSKSRTFTLQKETKRAYIYISGLSIGQVFNNVQFKFQLQKGSIATSIEPYGEKVCSNRIDDTNKKLDEMNDTLNNDDVNGANGKGAEFFNNFENNDYGLSDIITIPLNLIKSCTTTNCQVLTLTIPFVNKTLTLPCMTEIYREYFGSFLTVYQTITFGIVAYWVSVQIYAMVKGFKDPNNDKIEVVDL